jgi:hypothetical protein
MAGASLGISRGAGIVHTANVVYRSVLNAAPRRPTAANALEVCGFAPKTAHWLRLTFQSFPHRLALRLTKLIPDLS